MNYLELLKTWIINNPTSFNLLKYLVLIVVILFLIFTLRRFIKKNLPENSIRYKSQKGIEVIGYLFLLFITVSFFTGTIKDFGLAIGLLTAGITITLQELILSIAGSFYIFFVRVYKPGDRIEINGIKGDVIDIDSVYTTMMEIGEWVSSDNYSGRVVKLSNAFVFKVPVYNYSQDFPFLWDELLIPIRYGSNMELAKKMMTEIAQEQLSDYVDASINQWKKVVDKYYIEDAQVEPSIAVSMTDNWMSFNLRYIVDHKKRRITKHLLSELIEKKIRETNGEIELASSTVEIVRIPPIKS